MSQISVIIPAYNEAECLPEVLKVLKGLEFSDFKIGEIVVVDNASTDDTAELARVGGATLVVEPNRGYGSACLGGIDYLRAVIPKEEQEKAIVVFLDADLSDYPEEMDKLVTPILKNEADFVISSRLKNKDSCKHVPIVSRMGNKFAMWIVNKFFGFQYTDMGPFRAISFSALEKLQMADPTWGWTLEMQIKAIEQQLRIKEVAVCYRARFSGKSKISQSPIGATKAAVKILTVLAIVTFDQIKHARNRRIIAAELRK